MSEDRIENEEIIIPKRRYRKWPYRNMEPEQPEESHFNHEEYYRILHEMIKLLPKDKRWTVEERAEWIVTFLYLLDRLVKVEDDNAKQSPYPTP